MCTPTEEEGRSVSRISELNFSVILTLEKALERYEDLNSTTRIKVTNI